MPKLKTLNKSNSIKYNEMHARCRKRSIDRLRLLLVRAGGPSFVSIEVITLLWFLFWWTGLILHFISLVLAVILLPKARGARMASGFNALLFLCNAVVCILAFAILSRGHPTAQFNTHSEDAMSAWMTWMDIWPTLFGVAQALIFVNLLATLFIAATVKKRMSVVPGILGFFSSIVATIVLGMASPRA